MCWTLPCWLEIKVTHKSSEQNTTQQYSFFAFPTWLHHRVILTPLTTFPVPHNILKLSWICISAFYIHTLSNITITSTSSPHLLTAQSNKSFPCSTQVPQFPFARLVLIPTSVQLPSVTSSSPGCDETKSSHIIASSAVERHGSHSWKAFLALSLALPIYPV